MNPPRVSIIIPNYNHSRLLPRCLDAFLNQSVLPHEILVLDDASTDNSLEILRDYERRHPVLRVAPNPRNLGVVATLNRGLELATGDYVSFPAADDEVLPGLFQELLPWLTRHPEAGIVGGLTEWRCQSTGLNWLQGRSMPDTAGYQSPDAMIQLARAGRLAISGQHALYRKDALRAAGGWIPELRWFTDAFGAWTVGFRHGIVHVPKVLSIFYLYPTSYYNSAQSRAQRRAALDHLLGLLASPAYADVAPRIRASGLIGGFGWPAVRVALGSARYRPFVNPPFLRHVARRSAELVGRRFFPPWFARLCLRLFYGRRKS